MGVTECDELLRGRRCWGAATSDAPLQRTQASSTSCDKIGKVTQRIQKRTMTAGTDFSVVRCLLHGLCTSTVE